MTRVPDARSGPGAIARRDRTVVAGPGGRRPGASSRRGAAARPPATQGVGAPASDISVGQRVGPLSESIRDNFSESIQDNGSDPIKTPGGPLISGTTGRSQYLHLPLCVSDSTSTQQWVNISICLPLNKDSGSDPSLLVNTSSCLYASTHISDL